MKNQPDKPTPSNIATVQIQNHGAAVSRYVKPRKTSEIPDYGLVAEIAENLGRNIRTVLADGTGKPFCDFFNVLTVEGKLKPCCRMLKPYVDDVHYSVEPEIRKGNKVVGMEGLKQALEKSRNYATERLSRRRCVTPRRYVRVKCAKCGYDNEVDLVGLGFAKGE